MQKKIVDELISFLPDRRHLSPSEIVNSGIFASFSGLHRFLKTKKIPTLRISQRKFFIDRQAFVNYLRSCATDE